MAKKEDKRKLNIPMLIISLVIILISIILNEEGVIRSLLWIISILIITINIVTTYKLRLHHSIIIFILLFFLSIMLDGIIVFTFKRIPVFTYNIISTEKTTVYNSIGLRVWQCDKNDFNKVKVDLFYNKGYQCDAEDIAVIDSNSFLNSVVENYSDYKNSYVKINGKISKKTGQNYIEMQPYEKTEVTLNGYVNFANNITLRIIFNESSEDLDNYDVYDEITTVGIIKNLEQESGNYVIYMYDSKVVSTINLNDYTVIANPSKKCETEKNIIYSNEQTTIYTYCLEDLIVTYPNDTKYELASVLSSKRISEKNLHEHSLDQEANIGDNSIIYRFDTYSLLVCDKDKSKDIIYGPPKMSFEDVTCELKEEISKIEE